MIAALLAPLVAGAWLAAQAQPSATPPRVAVVAAAHAPDVASRTAAFRGAMRDLGYEDGRNVVLEFRYADERLDRIPGIIDDLIRRKVDVIVSAGPSVTRPARAATSSIPIVMAFDADPVGSGVVASLARPGGNVTGLSILATDLAGKQLELLKGIVPKLGRLAVLENTAEPGNADAMRSTRQAAAALGIAVHAYDVSDPARIESSFADAKRAGVDAVVVMSSPQVLFHRKRFAQAADANRLATLYPYTGLVDAGGLIAYGVEIDDLFRRAAAYVDRLLKGAKAADLPVELPSRFVLAVNVGAARRIGLTVPPDVLARADRVVR